MQLEIRLDGRNVIDVAFNLAAVDPAEPYVGGEVVAATLTKSELPDLEMDDFVSLIGEVMDQLAAPLVQKAAPVEDWREDFRRRRR